MLQDLNVFLYLESVNQMERKTVKCTLNVKHIKNILTMCQRFLTIDKPKVTFSFKI